MWPFDDNKVVALKQVEGQIFEASKNYKAVFSTPEGQWVLNDLSKRCFDRITTFDPDEKKMALNEGRRSIFNYIRTMVEKDLTQIMEDLTK